jgi:hypothetical protein
MTNARDSTPLTGRFLEALVTTLSAAMLATGAATASTGATTVLSGKVVLAPAAPVCRVGTPCSRPLPGFRLEFSRRHVVVARTRTDRHGRYRTRLAPGDYAVSAPGRRPGPGGGLAPRRIHVPAAARATRSFTYDAGIR